jgi:hypothetical protein
MNTATEAIIQEKNLGHLKRGLIEAKETHASLSEALSQKKTDLDAKVFALMEEFNQSNSELILNSDLAAQNVDRLERELKAAIVETYKTRLEAAKAAGEDPEKVSKQLGDGLSVRNGKKLFDYEHRIAVDWARVNAPYLLDTVIDKLLFQSLMDELDSTGKLPDFVKITKIPSAVISFK